MADRIVVMKEGVVQQVASPKDVYTRPRNLHVARFMGYRNVLPFTLEGMAGDDVRVAAGGVNFTGIPMAGFDTKDVVVALRPDDIERADEGSHNAFDATVETVEYGGRDSLLRAVTPFGAIWARVAGDFAQGERLRLRVAPARTLVYAAERA